jgi:hypothetical protein
MWPGPQITRDTRAVEQRRLAAERNLAVSCVALHCAAERGDVAVAVGVEAGSVDR